MDYDTYNTEDKQQRMRAIIITTAIAVIVLGIAIWAIIAIISGRNSNNVAVSDDNTIVAVDDGASKEKGKTEVPATTFPADNTTAPSTEGVSTQTQQAPAVATTTPSEVPTTGPEDLLPLALVAGSAAMFASSRNLAKREA